MGLEHEGVVGTDLRWKQGPKLTEGGTPRWREQGEENQWQELGP
jgi:hypothetical protein